jgi:hypothetical protein
MTPTDFIRLVQAMREAQRKAEGSRTSLNLRNAAALEARVDAAAKMLLDQPPPVNAQQGALF